MKTNVYKASYGDLSELTVNADSLFTAMLSLRELRPEEEPKMIRNIISNIAVPYPMIVPEVTLDVKAVMQDGSALPNSIAVRPNTLKVPVGGFCILYTIDTSIEPTVDFVGWFVNDECISEEESYMLKINVNTDVLVPLYIEARYAPKPVIPTVTVNVSAEMEDGTSVPETITVSPTTEDVEIGSSVTASFTDTTATPLTFLGWYVEDTLIGDTNPFEYIVSEHATPYDTISIVAKFSN